MSMFRVSCINRIFSVNNLNRSNYCTKPEFRNATQRVDKGDGKQAQFSSAKIGPFFQSSPQLENQYTGDAVLQSYLHRYIPEEVKCVFKYFTEGFSLQSGYHVLDS